MRRDLWLCRWRHSYNYAAFLAMPIRLRLDHDDAGKQPAGRHSEVAWIGIVSMAKDP